MLTLYKDKKHIFECKVKIENANLNNAKARLVLSGVQMDHIFNGKLDKMGNFSAEIPPLHLIEKKEGAAILEVIVDGAYFEALTTEYKLVSKEVTVENVTIKDNSTVVSIQAEIVEAVVPKKTIEKTLPENLFKSTTKTKDIKTTKSILEAFSKIKIDDKTLIKEHIQYSYKPSKESKKWANGVFKNPNSNTSKIVMYILDKNS